MRVKFAKYHGCGNDFVIIDNRQKLFDVSVVSVKFLCDRHFGIGADGLMLLENDPKGTDFMMRYFNSDGCESTMCGNGGRAISLFAYHLGIGSDKAKKFRGIDGEHSVQVLSVSGNEGVLRLSMIDVDNIEGGDGYTLLNTGSPHYIQFVDDVDNFDIVGFGRKIRYEDYGGVGGVNVNVVQILSENTIKIRTYERGVENETLACGTGATAAAITTAIKTKNNAQKILVKTQGGELIVSWQSADNKLFRCVELEGAAKKTFEGVIDIDDFL